jgi:hypothetical protein
MFLILLSYYYSICIILYFYKGINDLACVSNSVPLVGNVGVVIGGLTSSAEVTDAIVKALILEGLDIASILVTTVKELSVLPYATVNFSKNVSVVISSGVVINDPNGGLSNYSFQNYFILIHLLTKESQLPL